MIRRSWDVERLDRDNVGAVGVFIAGCEGADGLLFGDVRVASSANQFLDGLLSEERRKTGWMRAEAAGDPGPWRQQAVLGHSHWDAEALVAIVRDYVVENLADPDAVLVIDETGFLKQGKPPSAP
jgi:SRSO17 transposase